jgi:hypothetical protein
MSDDWKIGDLALCVAVSHPMFSDISRRLNVGTAYTVVMIGRPLRALNGERGLGFAEVSPTRKERGYPESMFRKIRPDEHEKCEPEFVELLKRSKRKVGIWGNNHVGGGR